MVALLSSLFFASSASALPAVVHGSPVAPASPIYQALVRFPLADGDTGCSGALIAPDVAITAGHCVRGGFAGEGAVALTVARASDPCSSTHVVATAYAPGAQPDGVLVLPDVALVRLSASPCGTVPAQLGDAPPPREGDLLWAAGFGIGGDIPAVPSEIALRLMPQTKAALVAEYAGEDPSWQAMAANDFDKYGPYYEFALPAIDYGTICGGDSGGPVFEEKSGVAVLRGENGAFITHPAKGVPSCNYAYVQLLTPLAPYLSWIRGQLATWAKP